MDTLSEQVPSGNDGVLEVSDFVGACPLLVLVLLMAAFGRRYVGYGQLSAFERAARDFERDLPSEARTGWDEPPSRDDRP